MGYAERDRKQSVILGLKWRHQSELDQLLRQLKQPGSVFYQRYLSADEFDERFGPAPNDVATVIAELAAHGLTVSDVSASGQLITATGSVTAVEQAFAVKLTQFEVDGTLAVAPDRAPTVPSAIASVVANVTGLDSRETLRPSNTGPRIPPQDGSPFQPNDIARAYDFTPLYAAGIRGDGSRASTIAIATAFGFQAADVTEFWASFGVSRGLDQVEVIPVGGTTTQTIDETTLDVEWAGAMAPGARVLAYVGPNSSLDTFTSVYDRIVSDNRASVMTITSSTTTAGGATEARASARRSGRRCWRSPISTAHR